MDWLDLLMRWLHLTSVIILLGAIVCLRLVLNPILAKVSEENSLSGIQAVQIRLKLLVHSSIAGILVSGLYNTHLMWRTTISPYPTVYLVKILLVLVVLVVSFFATTGLSKWPERFSQCTRWLNLALGLAMVIVALSAYLRILHQ